MEPFKTKYICLLSCLLLSSFVAPVYAEDSALPEIPKEGDPPNVTTPENVKRLDKPKDNPVTSVVNPLQAVLEKKSQKDEGPRTNTWVNKKELKRIEEEDKKAVETDKSNPNDSSEIDIDDKADTSVNDENDKNIDQSKTEKSQEEIEQSQADIAEQVEKDTKAVKEDLKDEGEEITPKKKYVRKLQNAAQNIQKPKAPERLWSID